MKSFTHSCHFFDPFVSLAICDNGCSHGGNCTRPNSCRCTQFWTGPSCTIGKVQTDKPTNELSYISLLFMCTHWGVCQSLHVSQNHDKGHYNWPSKLSWIGLVLLFSIDVDECSPNNGGCEQGCSNKRGAWRLCYCYPGYNISKFDDTKCLGECQIFILSTKMLKYNFLLDILIKAVAWP